MSTLLTKNFDLTNIAAMVVNHQLNETERAELVREIGAEVRFPSKAMQLLVAQVAHECCEQPKCTPEITIKIGIMYGALLGILAERERVETKRRRIA